MLIRRHVASCDQVVQFNEAILQNRLRKYVKIEIFWSYMSFKSFHKNFGKFFIAIYANLIFVTFKEHIKS